MDISAAGADKDGIYWQCIHHLRVEQVYGAARAANADSVGGIRHRGIRIQINVLRRGLDHFPVGKGHGGQRVQGSVGAAVGQGADGIVFDELAVGHRAIVAHAHPHAHKACRTGIQRVFEFKAHRMITFGIDAGGLLGVRGACRADIHHLIRQEVRNHRAGAVFGGAEAVVVDAIFNGIACLGFGQVGFLGNDQFHVAQRRQAAEQTGAVGGVFVTDKMGADGGLVIDTACHRAGY